jgi:hypothetical protein
MAIFPDQTQQPALPAIPIPMGLLAALGMPGGGPAPRRDLMRLGMPPPGGAPTPPASAPRNPFLGGGQSGGYTPEEVQRILSEQSGYFQGRPIAPMWQGRGGGLLPGIANFGNGFLSTYIPGLQQQNARENQRLRREALQRIISGNDPNAALTAMVDSDDPTLMGAALPIIARERITRPLQQRHFDELTAADEARQPQPPPAAAPTPQANPADAYWPTQGPMISATPAAPQAVAPTVAQPPQPAAPPRPSASPVNSLLDAPESSLGMLPSVFSPANFYRLLRGAVDAGPQSDPARAVRDLAFPPAGAQTPAQQPPAQAPQPFQGMSGLGTFSMPTPRPAPQPTPAPAPAPVPQGPAATPPVAAPTAAPAAAPVDTAREQRRILNMLRAGLIEPAEARMRIDMLRKGTENTAAEEAAKALGKATGEARAALPGALANVDSFIRNVDAVIDDPLRTSVTGRQGQDWYRNPREGFGPFNAIPNPFAMAWNAIPPSPENEAVRERISQLQGQAFLQAYNALRGAGTITEQEGQAAQRAIARLGNLGQDDNSYLQALFDARREMHNLYNVARVKAGLPPAEYTPHRLEAQQRRVGPAGQPPPSPGSYTWTPDGGLQRQ